MTFRSSALHGASRAALVLVLCTPPAAPGADLPAAVARIVQGHALPATSYGLIVQEVGSDTALVSANTDAAFNPASVMKLLTTFVALQTLGPTYTWQTEVYLDGTLSAGTLTGDLILKGYGDPSMVTEEFWRLLKTLRRRGLQSITGDLLIDNSYFALEPHDPAKFDGQSDRAYNVGPMRCSSITRPCSSTSIRPPTASTCSCRPIRSLPTSASTISSA